MPRSERRALAAAAALAVAAGLAGTPCGAAIATKEECARLASAAEEVACLRGALDASQAALARHPARRETVTTASQSRRAGASDQMGAEQIAGRGAVIRREKKAIAPVDQPAAAAAVASTDTRGDMIIQLANGQVWRIAEQPPVPLSLDEKQSYLVQVKASGFGGYRMIFTGLNREVVVRRVQ